MSAPVPRSFREHDEECDALSYEGGTCLCGLIEGRAGSYDMPVYGEDADAYDGRLGGPALDW